MADQQIGFELPPEIYTPCDTPGYKPAYTGFAARDLNIVTEGGGLRGIFAAGVQDFLMDMGIWGKNLFGVSAGSLCGFNYVAGTRGRTIYLNMKFCSDWRYLSMRSFFVTGNAYGVNFAFHDVPEKYCPQDNDGFRNSPCTLTAVATDIETGKPAYLTVKEPTTDWVYLRASSAMPFVSQPVLIDGRLYLDGGLSDAIPIGKSLEVGAKKHLVLLTQTRDYRKGPSKLFQVGAPVYKGYPELFNVMEHRHEVYNEVRERIFDMHDSGDIFAIWPQSTPEVGHMEKDPAKLFSLYFDGYLEAQRQWPALQEYLEIS